MPAHKNVLIEIPALPSFSNFKNITALALAVALLSGCVKTIDNDLSTVTRELPSRGTNTEIAVAPGDATAVTILAMESESFTIGSATKVDDKVRILVSHGTTLASWGEVGRVDLRPKSESNTAMYAVVEPLVGIVGKPSIEGDYMAGWKKVIAERSATLAARRNAKAYLAYTVKSRRKGESFSASSGGGAGLGFLAGGLIGAAAGGSAEARQGQRTPYEYDLKTAGQTETVRSFVPMETSACVGLADNDMEPTSAEQIAKAKKAALENDDEYAPPVDPTIDIVVLAPLAETACQL